MDAHNRVVEITIHFILDDYVNIQAVKVNIIDADIVDATFI